MTIKEHVQALLWIGVLLVLTPNVFSDTNPSSDIIFVVDGSDRVSQAQYNQMKAWMKDLVEFWNVSPDKYRVGIVQYGNGAHMESTLMDGSTSFQQVKDNIDRLTYTGGTSDAAAALTMASGPGFSQANGGRPDKPQIIIHVGAGSDGKNPQLLVDAAKNATSFGQRVYTVGVGSGWNGNQLEQSSSSPNTRYVLQANNFGELGTVLDPLLLRVENELPVSPGSLPSPSLGCLKEADIVFVVDGSYSVTASNFLKVKDNLKNLVMNLPVSDAGVHVGVVQYSGKTSLEFPLGSSNDRLGIMSKIDQIPYLGGGTRTGNAIEYMREEMFSSLNGGRQGVPRIGIIITDGTSSDVQHTIDESNLARQQGIELLAVGVGPSVNSRELEGIAGDASRVYTVSGFDNLNSLVDPILQGTCGATATMPPPTPPTTSNLVETCVDAIDNCQDYIEAYKNMGGYCQVYKAQAQSQCSMSCGFCTTIVPHTPPPCVDEWANCTDYFLGPCTDPIYMPFMKNHCPMRCGLCDVKSQYTGFKGKCLYKNALYDQGEKWYDGCDYECVCSDAAHGKYTCTNKCDVYYDLPAECTLVRRNGECCLQPVCNFQSNLLISDITQPVRYNGKDYCEYKGHRYSQNEYFEDGCDKKCTCVDVTTGRMSCSDYCPSYDKSSLPSNCFLEKAPGSCCEQPRCEFQTTVGSFTGQGTISGTGIGKDFFDINNQPECKDLNPDCIFFDKSSCTDPTYEAYMIDTCPKYCNACHIKFAAPTPGPLDKCYYDGVLYSDGDHWEPDCAHQCTCDTQLYGFYRCSSKCTDYQNIPKGCSVETLAGQCCPQIVCQNQVIVPSTTNVLNLGSGDSFVIDKNGTKIPLLPQLRPDGTIDPTSGVQIPAIKGCLYNGRLLVQGETGRDTGCGPICECKDADTGTMSCIDRCPIYENVDYRCKYIPDARDSCCQIPDCPPNLPKPSSIYNKPKPLIGVVQMPDWQTLLPTNATPTGQSTPTPAATTQQPTSPTTPKPTTPPTPPPTTQIPTQFPPGKEPLSYNPPPTMPPPTSDKPIVDCGNNPADIHFLLDASGSLETVNFKKQLAFVKQFADHFDIGPNAIQIGATIFSSTVSNQFWMNDHLNKPDLLNAIDNIPYPGGDTYTDVGLEFVRQNAFTTAHGDRPNVNNILIVITDGQSTRPNKTKIESDAIHQENMDIYAIGVGDHIDKGELQMIASDPANVFTVSNFDALDTIQDALHIVTCEGSCFFNLTGKNYKEGERWQYDCDYNCLCVDGYTGKYICHDVCKRFICPTGYSCTEYPDPDYSCCNLLKIEVPTLPPVTTAITTQTPNKVFPPGCEPLSYNPPPVMPTITGTKAPIDCGQSPADIHFLLDNSGSVGASDFDKQLSFVKKFVNSFDVGPNAVQVGVTIFSSTVKNQFWLNDHHDKTQLLDAIESIQHTGGSTQTDQGLMFVRQNAFTTAHGDRPGVPNILIVITDGESTNPVDTKTQADLIHKENINIFSIGVGSHVDTKELQLIASDPNNVFTVDNFQALDNIRTSLQQSTCEGSCYFNASGKNYKEGERWSDGCGYNCLCTDGRTGQYQCKDVCKKFTCPAGYKCTEYPDPDFACCNLLRIEEPALPSSCPKYTTAQYNATQFTAGCQPPSYNPPPTMPPGHVTKNITDCGTHPADIHFLLDASGSVGDADFQKQRDFVKKFASAFNISSTGVQIGVTIFSSNYDHQFWMNDNLDKASLLAAIDKIPYTGGVTRTDLGLKFVRENAFTKAHGGRDGVNNILIVTTDGDSTNAADTKTQADLIHKENINIFAIGVGSNVQKDELELIASDPQNVFTVNGFDALDNIQASLQKTACEGSCYVNKTGKNYKEGEYWSEGCDKNCLCVDGSSGKFICENVCKKYSCPEGSICTEYPDPNYSCCNLIKIQQPQLPPVCHVQNSTKPPVTAAPVKVYPPHCQPQSYVPPPTMPPGYSSKPPKDCGQAPADIHFLIDVSGSVRQQNFDKQMKFIKNFASSFDIGPNAVQIGATTFSSSVRNQFWMNGHDNKPALLAALDKIPYPGGTTHTELGLNFIRNNAFTKAHGDRDGVNNILIVITDGASTLPDKTKLEADAIHQSNINIFAIGVGNNVKMSELEMIASDKQNVFTVDNFDALNNIQHQLQQTTCEGTCYYNKTGKNYKEGERWTDGCDKNCLCVDGNAGHYICNDVCKKNVCPNGFQCSEYPDPNMPCCTLLKVDQPALPKNCPVYTTAQFNLTKFPAGCQPFSYNPPPVMPVLNATKAPIDCGQLPADIHFLLDNSGSVGGSDFTKQLEFVKKFANSFDIGPNNVQIGVTLFSNGVTNEFWMNDHNTKQKLINAIDRIIYTGGTTRTDLGLKYIRNNAFTAAHGDRPGVNNILIVTTDGKSTNPQSTKTEANLIHKENMNIFAVGVGQNVDRNELETIATDPQNVFTVNNFNALDSIQSQLQQSSCEGYCFFNKTNTKYKEGQRWNDGCDKNCLCVDGTSGKYECNDVCKKMTCPAGSKCSEVDDPNYSCCKLLRVDEQPTPDPACFTPPPTAPPTTPKPQIVCEPQSYVAPPVMPVGYTSKPKDCGQNKADIHFLIDASGSVRPANFQKQLDFIENFANAFDIGPNGVQIGATIFSSSVQNQFWMNKYLNKTGLISAIKNIPYPGGTTHTGDGVEFVRQNAFTKPHGDRDGVSNILIVMTDGQSTDTAKLTTQTGLLHKNPINSFAIGVGSNVDTSELQMIASDSHNVFTVDSFDALNNIQQSLQQTTCEGVCHYNVTGKNYLTGDRWTDGCNKNCLCVDGNAGHYICNDVCRQTVCPAGYKCTERQDPNKPCCKLLDIQIPALNKACPTAPTLANNTDYPQGCEPVSYVPPPTMPPGVTPKPITDCGQNPADIHFLIDASGSVMPSNYQKQLDFVEKFAQAFDIGPTGVQVGVTIFSSSVAHQFWMNNHTTKADLIKAIQNIPYPGGTTQTGAAIQFVRNNAFTKAHGDRSNVNNILIVMTDGQSSNRAQLTTQADLLHQSNINSFAIGVGSGADKSELELIASDPQNVFTVDNFDALDNIQASLQKVSCEGSCYSNATGEQYKQGHSWSEGCEKNCICVDGSTGKFLCNDMCKKYTCPEGYNCTEVDDPNNSCCKLLKMDLIPAKCHAVTPAVPTAPSSFPPGCEPESYNPLPIMPPTSKASNGMCTYNSTGRSYKQGERWQDGCDKNCLCVDGDAGRYECNDVCKKLTCPQGFKCHEVQDPDYPCCKVLRVNDPAPLPAKCNKYTTAIADVTTFQRGCRPHSYKNPPHMPAGHTSAPPKDCGVHPADIHFLLDASSSVGQTDFDKQVEFVKKFAQSFNISNTAVQIGATIFSTNPTNVFWMNDHLDKASLLKAINNIPYQRGNTQTDLALSYVRQNAFTKAHGDRAGVNNILIVVTDGQSTDTAKTKAEADKIHLENMNVFAVGVGSGVDDKELQTIASDPQNVFTVDGFDALDNIQASLQKTACEGSCYDNKTGKNYKEGEHWSEGCDKNCLCVDGSSGKFICRDVCKHFTCPTGHTCTDVKDPNYSCCNYMKVAPPKRDPKCILPPPALVFPPGKNPPSFNPPPTMPPGKTPNPNAGVCVFNMTGRSYKEGERWQYGCDYNCICVDGKTGLYQCNDVCKHFTCPAGATCTEYQDPDYACCKLMDIVIPTLPPLTTAPPIVTQKVQIDYCVDSQGDQHPEGSVWLPSCDLKCVCVNAAQNSISCGNRCPQYYNLPSQSCTEIADPLDPCCKIPVCHGSNTGPTYAPNVLTPVPLPGGGFEVTGKPGNNFCVYNSHNYLQNEEWFMGCDYKCTCIDQLKGRQNCEPRCPRYDTSQMPPMCHLVTDPADTCCQKPECTFDFTVGTIGGSKDKPTVPAIYATIDPNNFDPNSVPRCEDHGNYYYEGAEWYQGCAQKCRCEDAVKNIKSCEDRCPMILAQPDCVIITDPDNPCCKKKECQVSPTLLQVTQPINPIQIPTLAPEVINGGPGQINHTPNKCVFRRVEYNQGDKWFDGCDKKCECTDAAKGIYQCTNRCTKYPDVLPTQCQLFPIPGDQCCEQLECGHMPPLTVAPPTQMLATLNPPTLAPGVPTIVSGVPLIPTLKPQEVCQDGNDVYTVGQTWFVGCDLKCFCANGGAKQCQSRCKTYPAPAAGITCTLKPDPMDSACCMIPDCHSTAPTGAPPSGPHVLPSIAPPGTFTGIGATLIPPTRDPSDPNAPLPTPTPKCLYKGVHYDEGDSWKDGCDVTCVCEDASKGAYKCTDICPSYPDAPAGCYMIRDASNLCCEVPFCPDNPAVLVPPTDQSGHTLRPTYNPHPIPSKCIYNGVSYAQGESWADGCEFMCTCDDAQSGDIRCDRRCPQWRNLDAECRFITDLDNPCCRRPVCPPKIPATVAPPTNSHGQTVRPVVIPIPTAVPHVIIGQRVDGPNVDPNAPKKCEYKGQSYDTGDGWTDGACGKRCRCLDEVAGKYECVERCPAFKASDMPAYCHLETDPTDSCCLAPVCSDPHNIVEPPTLGPNVKPNPMIPTFQVPTSTPVCTYKNKVYLKGQVWEDQCSKKCECIEVGSQVSAFCTDRCPDYGLVPSGCSLVPDPRDVDCCKMISCVPPVGPDGTLNVPGVSPTPFVVTNVPGVIIGRLPTQTPGETGLTRKRCVYDGQEYTTGQTWRDGCEKQCQCLDMNEGLYKCTEMCSKYNNVPLQCSLHRDPNNACCEIMICDPQKVVTINYNTLAPPTRPHTRVPTTVDPLAPVTPRPVPTINILAPTGVYTLPPTQRPATEFCVYNGAPYQQGATFDRSCQQTCRCDDAKNNIINCFDRCPTYSDLSPDCTLEVDPNDACCRVKHCTSVPNVVNVISDPTNPNAPIPGNVPQPVIIPGSTITGETPGPQSGPDDMCVYQGQKYGALVTWKDGCGVTCTCLNPATNKYQCTDKCNKFENVPPNCVISKDADKCCDVATCYDPDRLSTAAPPTIIGGVTISPQIQPTRVPRKMCMYDGHLLTQGQMYMDDSCNQKCVCEDADNNYVKCVPRCMVYPANPSCELVPDPADPVCCKVPKCGAQNPLNPVGVTGGYTVIATPPTVVPPTMATSYPNQPTPSQAVPKPRSGCYYNRRVYSQGEKWQDNCENCECVDALSNVYKCVSMCPAYPDLPTYCTYVYDPMNPCCKKPECKLHEPPTLAPGQTTLTPPKSNFCVDKGVPHLDGSTWEDGCSSILTCEDASTNTISKRDRCAKTQPPQTGCKLETDPRDSCCQILTCEKPDTTDPDKVIISVPGTITGQSKPPQSPNPLVPRAVGCYVNHRVYRQGESWADGCSYLCECIDEINGGFACDERCQPLPQLPSTCSLVTDPTDSCCQIARCTPPSLLVPDLYTIAPDPQHPGTTIQMLKPPIKGVCLYNGNYLREGQVYYDGNCDKVCTCEDTDKNLVRCVDMCAKVSAAPGCTLIPDPANPTCCQVPECPMPPTYTPPSKPGYLRPPTNKPPVIFGSPAPGTVVNGNNPPVKYNGCQYNGVTYNEGQTWSDGCDYYCECVNATSAQYKCSKRCPTVLPQASCVLAQDPNDPCCEALYCDFVNPTPFPSGVPPSVHVIQPNQPQTNSPYVIPGIPNTVTIVPTQVVVPSLGFCLYDGAQYLQSQSWNVQCDQKCTCLNATAGLYSCVDRCPTFAPAPGCTMRTSPTDPCCLVQDCGPNFNDPIFQVTVNPSQPNVTYSPGFIKPGEVIIPPGNPPTFIKNFNTPVLGPGTPSDVINIYKTKCVAEDGHFYAQGESWNTNNNERCVCIHASTNRAQCTQRCGDYYFLPNNCRLETDPNNPPCRVAICPSGSAQTPVPFTAGPTITTRSTTPVTTNVPVAYECRYKDGRSFPKNDVWSDGCQQCKCIDPAGNNYQCTRSCPAIKDLPSYCSMVPNPADHCCEKVQCIKDGVTLEPLLVDPITHISPTLDPSKTNVIPIMTHPVITGHGTPINVSPSVLRQYGGADACVYKGQLHRPGDSWDDGCEQSCTCEKNAGGLFTCVQICGLQPPVPSYCRKVHIPGQCCDTITCDIPHVGQYVPSSNIDVVLPGSIPQLKPGQSTLTVLPSQVATSTITVSGGGTPVNYVQIPNIKNRCIKDNKAYAQGETWSEGCDIECECMEEATGYYQCTHKCPVYGNIKAGCVLTSVPGQCCRRLMCNDPNTGLTFDPIIHPRDDYLIYQKWPVGNSGFRPYYVPNGVSKNFMGCYFNGKVYAEGQSWQDRCSYHCTCVDGQSHRMECTSLCSRYDHIPATCTLQSSSNHCCQEVHCPNNPISLSPTPVHRPGPLNISEGSCVNTIDNCEDYTLKACAPQYASWAKRFCPKYCGLCSNSPLQPRVCEDEDVNCAAYGQQSCRSPDTKMWMHTHCYKTCGYCNSCEDIDDTCDQMNQLTCNGAYKPWAQQMCAKSCGFCNANPGQPSIPASPATTLSNWVLLLKGVSNAPGDLYNLWSQPGGQNQNVPQASVLTADYPAHYKSDLADDFGRCNFDKIRVGIYNKGVERGYVIFNAHGATKQNVFDPSRIISSTWNDIRGQSSVFTLPKNPTTGREFSFGQNQPSCNGQGWLYVSTFNKCNYASGSNSFYFSPTTGAVQYKDMIEGDVIAVMAQGGSCAAKNNTKGGDCKYLNQFHNLGEKWNEGCDKECECIQLNSTHTAVQCKELCATYNSVPANCRLEAPPGECCKKPVCSGCLDPKDASKVYAVGDSWRDGCTYDCTCTHTAGKDQVSCRQVCLNFNLTPAQNATCTWPTPAPGKCCALPKCPGLNFNIPDANKQDY